MLGTHRMGGIPHDSVTLSEAKGLAVILAACRTFSCESMQTRYTHGMDLALRNRAWRAAGHRAARRVLVRGRERQPASWVRVREE